MSYPRPYLPPKMQIAAKISPFQIIFLSFLPHFFDIRGGAQWRGLGPSTLAHARSKIPLKKLPKPTKRGQTTFCKKNRKYYHLPRASVKPCIRNYLSKRFFSDVCEIKTFCFAHKTFVVVV